MAPPKRPPQKPNNLSTVVIDGADEPTESNSGVGDAMAGATVNIAPPPADENAGATAFVRIDAPRAPPRPAQRSAPTAPSEVDGATAFVRVDRPARAGRGPAAPPPRRPVEPSAPRKGLQVQLPDEEPAPAPKPKPAPVAAAPDKKGRRGAWWDEEQAKIPDEPEPTLPEPEPEPEQEVSQSTLLDIESDQPANDGATAFVRARPADEEVGGTVMVTGGRGARSSEPAEPEVAPPPKREAEAYRPVPADDYEGHLSSGTPRWRVWLRRVAIASVGLFLIGMVGLVACYVWISRETPAMESVSDYKPAVTAKVVAQDGTVVGEFFREKRTLVKMDQIPRTLIQAVTAAEDKDFYKHTGVNILAMVRAAIVDVLSGRRRLGASTITQQVVKNLMLTRDKKFKRKLKEILLAWRLERNLSKDDILYLYLNDNNFGRAHYGVEEASLYYFGKHVQDIDLGEAALLAGLPQNPQRLNPRLHPENAKRRQTYVLDRMLANHAIDQVDHDREVEKPLALPPPPAEPPGAWYLQEVRRQLVAQYGEAAVDTSGWTIEIAMDPKLQAVAEHAVQDGLRAVDKRQGWRGPIFKIEAASLSDLAVAIGRRVGQTEAPEGAVLTADLDGVNEKAQGAPETIARAASVRTLVEGGIYAGVVTSVTRAEAHVQLAPGVEGPVPFSSMTWARPFKPESKTPSPNSAADVLSVGDVVSVRVANLRLQRTAMSTRVAHIDFSLEQDPAVQGAFAAIDLKTRGVLAIVGGADIAKSQFDRATQAKRQPGSSFKPFLYAAAIESGKYTPVTKVDDSPEVITDPWSGKTWKPQNFEKDEFDGPITLRRALAESKNTVAVKLVLELGLDKVRAQASLAGLSSTIPQSYTAALGTGEVGILEEINAYATIATMGRKGEPIFIRRVIAKEGTTVQKSEANPEQQMRADVAYVTADMMRSVIDDSGGTAHSLAALGRPAAGKTGTASEHRDGWFIGFTPSIVAGAWVGFDDHRIMGSLETGGHCAGPIWLAFMRAATAGQPPEDWPPPPPGAVEAKVNSHTGTLAAPDDPYAVREVFISGTEPAPAPDETLEPPSQEQFYQQGQ